MGLCDDDVSVSFCWCTRCALVHFYSAAQTVDLKMTLSMKTEVENFWMSITDNPIISS